LFGVAEVPHMPVDVFPEFAPPIVEVQTEGQGMSTSEVEELVTSQLEESFAGTPGLDVMRSQSVPGLASVRLVFKLGTDPLLARQWVQERLAQVIPTLPLSSGTSWMMPPSWSTSGVLRTGLSPKRRPRLDLRM